MKERIAFVTGAAGGIGRHIALGYARQGYRVIATDIAEAVFEEPSICFLRMDLARATSIQEVFKIAVERYGTVHVLVNNGAISTFNRPVLELTPAEFDKVIAVNLRGSFLCAQAFIAANTGQDYGRIINIASTRWNQNEAGWEAYGASKGALVSLTNTLAVSLSDTPITVNAISPGWIQTECYDKLTIQDHRQHPSGRVGKPSDIVRACLFLSEEGNDFINAANLVIDGGMTKKMIYHEE